MAQCRLFIEQDDSMSFKWKLTSVSHVLQTDTVHTATAAAVSGHASPFGSLIRNALDCTTSIVTTDEFQVATFCAAVVVPATVLLLRSLVRDIKPDEVVSIKDRVKIQEEKERGFYITVEQKDSIQKMARELGVGVSELVEKLDKGNFIPKRLEDLTSHEGNILIGILSREQAFKDSSILEKGQR